MHRLRPQVVERLLPFSHRSGFRCLLPFSSIELHCYPQRLECHHPLHGRGVICWDLPAMAEGFTVQVDLERGVVWVWMRLEGVLFRYALQATANGEGIIIDVRGDWRFDFEGSWPSSCLVKGSLSSRQSAFPRLSFGSHRKQDWEGITSRADPREFLPFWVRLGDMTLPEDAAHAEGGFFEVLDQLSQEVEVSRRAALVPALIRLFQAAFDGGLCPRLQDELHRGMDLPLLKGQPRPTALLKRGSQMAYDLFLRHSDGHLVVMPCVPTEFFCGRLVGWSDDHWGEVDLEWRKHDPRRMVLRPKLERALRLELPHQITSFRLRRHAADRGVRLRSSELLRLDPGHEYFLDQFLK